MKLSEILKPQKKYAICPNVTGEELPEPNSRNIQFQYGFNTALTSCDREIDREALARALWKKDFISDFADEVMKHKIVEYLNKADHIISTMPTWLKPTERK